MSLFDKIKSVPFNKDEKGAVMPDDLNPEELTVKTEENYDQFFSPDEIKILHQEGFSHEAMTKLFTHCVDK